ncbi:MAG: hypothetical protein H0U00_05310 [Actinobacteria bacterium]|nr:hypothetical protein [Actinomycetota bacterium]
MTLRRNARLLAASNRYLAAGSTAGSCPIGGGDDRTGRVGYVAAHARP